MCRAQNWAGRGLDGRTGVKESVLCGQRIPPPVQQRRFHVHKPIPVAVEVDRRPDEQSETLAVEGALVAGVGGGERPLEQLVVIRQVRIQRCARTLRRLGADEPQPSAAFVVRKQPVAAPRGRQVQPDG